jgi:hypothetical protein
MWCSAEEHAQERCVIMHTNVKVVRLNESLFKMLLTRRHVLVVIFIPPVQLRAHSQTQETTAERKKFVETRAFYRSDFIKKTWDKYVLHIL